MKTQQLLEYESQPALARTSPAGTSPTMHGSLLLLVPGGVVVTHGAVAVVVSLDESAGSRQAVRHEADSTILAAAVHGDCLALCTESKALTLWRVEAESWQQVGAG